MSFLTLEQQLDLLELQFNKVSSVLIDGDADSVSQASAGLQQCAVNLLQMVDELGRTQLETSPNAKRIKALADGMGVLRETLLRRSAYVDRALQLVIPSGATRATYSAGNANAYGAGPRASGAFKAFSA